MTVQVKYITLKDQSRDREIECKIYNGGNVPIVFSHGLGGSMESYKYLGEALAEAGFFVIFPNHNGIDAKLLKEKRPYQALMEATKIEENLRAPALDVRFVMDWLEEQENIDSTKIGIGGHSWGSFTTLQICGQRHTSTGDLLGTKDERVTAALAISPSAPKIDHDTAFAEVTAPILHITGTKDDSPVSMALPEDRQIPYKLMNKSDQYLIVFEGADHMVFAAQRRGNKFSDLDLEIMESTADASVAFFNKYLLEEDSPIDNDDFYANLAAQNSNERK